MFNNKNFLQMRTLTKIKKGLPIFGLATTACLLLVSCGSTQSYIDTDGVYNSERQKVVETHHNSNYYEKYFEEKTQEAEYFTDIENYNSYQEGAAGWGDHTSETVIHNNWYNYYGNWMSPWYGGFGFHWYSSWGWGYPYYAWGYPYYYGYYGWGYPHYGYSNIRTSRAVAHRNTGIRPAAFTRNGQLSRNTIRSQRNTTLARTRTMVDERTRSTIFRDDRVPTRQTNSSLRNNRQNDYYRTSPSRNSTRNSDFRTPTRTQTPTMRTSSPSSRGFGGSTGSGRSMSTDGRR